MRTVLVLGATGFVGRALVPRLLDEGASVRAASRRAAAAETAPGSSWVRCDVREPSTLARAFEGVGYVYYLVHGMGAHGRDFRDVERASARAVAHQAAASGCERIVYLGGVAPAGEPSEHLASRLEVGEILRGGTVRTLELRAAMIIGAGSASWRIMRDLAMRLPMMVLPTWLDSRCRPVAIDDVVTALLDARRVPLESSAWFDIPGPDELSAREMLLAVGALRGRRIPAVRVPVLSPRLSAMWLKLVTGTDYRLARELVLGLTSDLLPRDERYFELTGHRARVSFEEAARRALAAERMGRAKSGSIARWEERLVARVGPRASGSP
jgi:uncharacterized protein YbjT (DUF2867 family)